MKEKKTAEIHWSFWVIGAIGLIFNLMGCMNHISQMNAVNVASIPDVYRELVENRPTWGTGVFALAVFGGSLGCFLLLLRKSFAVYVFIVALVGAVAAQIPFLGMANVPLAVWIGWLSQVVVSAFFIWYAKQCKKKGLEPLEAPSMSGRSWPLAPDENSWQGE